MTCSLSSLRAASQDMGPPRGLTVDSDDHLVGIAQGLDSRREACLERFGVERVDDIVQGVVARSVALVGHGRSQEVQQLRSRRGLRRQRSMRSGSAGEAQAVVKPPSAPATGPREPTRDRDCRVWPATTPWRLLRSRWPASNRAGLDFGNPARSKSSESQEIAMAGTFDAIVLAQMPLYKPCFPDPACRHPWRWRGAVVVQPMRKNSKQWHSPSN